jgi:hypothetical protein
MRYIVAITFASGCFNPTYNNPSCGPAGECPDGLTCNTEQQCVRSNGDGGNTLDTFNTVDTFVTDAPAACVQWKPHFFSPCEIGSPNGPITLTSGIYTYNTTLGTLVDASSNAIAHSTFTVDQGGTPAWGMNVTNLVVESNATLRVIGTKPLIVAAWGTIEIDGTIDVSSPTPATTGQTPSNGGAGADPAACAMSTGGDGTYNQNAAGGGRGGGFQGPGGLGGMTNVAPGGTKGAPVAVPHVVRGGCAGGSSGQAAISYGGLGGGAIDLSAQMTLTMAGAIKAGGGGGEAAQPGKQAGGGGGGAGGFVGLEALTLSLQSGVISANGGGGASGDANGGQAQNGQDGQPSTSAAQGGTGFACNSPGASGGASTTLNGQNAAGSNNNCGGGGGGGGVGFVLLFSNQVTSNTTVQSPSGIVNPF